MEKLPNIHPGEVLLHEFLEPMEVSAYRLSKDCKIPQTRISEIVKGKTKNKQQILPFRLKPIFWKRSKVLAWASR